MKTSKNAGYTKENLKDEMTTKSSTQTEDEVIVKLKLVEKHETDNGYSVMDKQMNGEYSSGITLTQVLKPNSIYMVTYYSGAYGEAISTLLPTSYDGGVKVRAVIPADGGSGIPGIIYSTNGDKLYFWSDGNLSLDYIEKLEIYELTSGVTEPGSNETQTEDKVIELYSSDVSHNDELDVDGLDLRKPGKYYIYDDDDIKEIDAYFGYTSDGKYPKYVFHSNILTAATAYTLNENDSVGQHVTILFGANKILYIEVTDRTVHIYNIFEI